MNIEMLKYRELTDAELDAVTGAGDTVTPNGVTMSTKPPETCKAPLRTEVTLAQWERIVANKAR